MEPELGKPQSRLSDKSTESDSTPKVDDQSESPKASCTFEFRPQPIVNGFAPLFPWDRGDRKVEISGPRLGDHLNIPNPQSSAGSRSSVVNDGGNAKYLAGNKASSHATFSIGSGIDELGHVGTGVGDTTDHVKFSEADFDQDDAPPEDKVEREDSEDQFKELENLGESIRAALIPVPQAGERNKFLPNDALDKIITKEKVRQELDRHMGPTKELDTLTDKVWEITTPSSSKSQGKETTRRKIFAILGLMDKVKDIIDFIQDGLYDNDLPFELLDGKRPLLRLYGKGKDGSTDRIPIFDKWRAHELESFNNYQWELIAPYFQLITETNRKVLHYNLQNRIILPFIEDFQETGRAGGRAEGGFGDVWRVKIHPAHHNCCEDTADSHENPSYAVKRLRHSDQEAFDAEVSNLKRFSKSDHLHLIKLLTTFKWREQFHLLFPWADGNLLDFWKRFPQPSHPKRDYNLALWFSEQCLGIVQGLKMIHTADVPSKSTNASLNTPKYPIHGRHGDLKPENILWFKSYKDVEDSWRGVLKISDFGLTRFHGTHSISHFENVAVSPTYRAPEYDIASKTSQSDDVWTLGCVLLEFVTWYLLGWDEVDRFSKERTIDDNREIREDVFFNFVNIREQNGGLQTGARAKLSVANEFQTLYEHKNCSDFILDLLTFIKDKLLRITPKKRAECKEIVKKFEELNNECVNDRDYCMRRVKKTPGRTGTALSELSAAALHLSDKQNNRIHRNNLPEHLGPVEGDPTLNESPDRQSLGSDPDHKLPTNSSTPERAQPERKGTMLERMGKSKLPPVAISSNDTQTTLSDRGSNETQKASPPSPKKVHFDNEKQQPSESGASEQGKDVSKMQDQPLDKSDQSEEQGKVTKGHTVRLQPESSSHPMGHTFSYPVLLPLTSTVAVLAPQEHKEVSVNSAEPPESTRVPGEPDFTVPPINSPADDALKGNALVNHDGIQNPPLQNTRPADLLGSDRTVENTRIEHNHEASSREGSLESANPGSQRLNIPITEQSNAPETWLQNENLRAAATSETHPRGVRRFLRCLCCHTHDD